MTKSKAVAGALALVVLGVSGCGGGDPCADLAAAVNQASAAPGCVAALATAKQGLGIPVDCSMADDTTLAIKEAEAVCFAQVTTCEDGGKSLQTLGECLKGALSAM